MKKNQYAVSYARVSSVRQAEKKISIPAQFAAIREWADKNDVTIIAEAADEGKSAFHKNVSRPRFKQLLEVAKRDPRVSLFLVHDASRFCRLKNQAVIHKADLEEHGVRVQPITSPEYDPNSITGIWCEELTN